MITIYFAVQAFNKYYLLYFIAIYMRNSKEWGRDRERNGLANYAITTGENGL